MREQLGQTGNPKCGVDVAGLFSHLEALVYIPVVLGDTPGSCALGSNETASGVKLALEDDHLDFLSAKHGILVLTEIGKPGNQPQHAANLFRTGFPQ